jgi:hypothetical protein
LTELKKREFVQKRYRNREHTAAASIVAGQFVSRELGKFPR